VFSVAGVRFAARADDVGGVTPWPGATAVPSETPYVAALVRHQKECLPVFDLATKLQRKMTDPAPLCLVAKHVDGPMVLCIDGHVPSLHMVDSSAIRYQAGGDPDIAGTCVAGNEELPLLNLTRLGTGSSRPS
jgi:chemotaxis signal transduction protein